MRKFTKGTLVFLYCTYIVCSFLPAEFTLWSGQKILGSEFLFALLNGTGFVSTWKISLIFPLGLGLGLFMTLFFSKKIYTAYVNIAVNFIFSAIYIISLISGIGKGVGIEICLGISALILIINVFSAMLNDGAENEKRAEKNEKTRQGTIEKQKKSVKNSKSEKNQKTVSGTKSEDSRANFMDAKLCPSCGKLLFANEICTCTLGENSESHPVKTHKCEHCGRILFGNEVCTCRSEKSR